MWSYPVGATPIDADEAQELIPQHITTQQQLNQWEQNNILKAEQWAIKQTFKLAVIAKQEFIKKLHVRMFDQTWRWAGQFRLTNKNIGIDWPKIPAELKILLDDLHYQIQNNVYTENELVARFHHRLVCIHPFPNGNGRHARLLVDIILLALGKERFSWGGRNYSSSSARNHYLEALRTADRHNYAKLIKFVRE